MTARRPMTELKKMSSSLPPRAPRRPGRCGSGISARPETRFAHASGSDNAQLVAQCLNLGEYVAGKQDRPTFDDLFEYAFTERKLHERIQAGGGLVKK